MASGPGPQPTYGYAPVRGAYFVHAGSTISAYEEVKLATTPSEHDLFDSLAEICGILVTLDSVEKCYMRDSLSDSDYADACSRLLMQYRSFLAGDLVRQAFVDIDSFQADWAFDCPRAKERIRVGVPATMASMASPVVPSPVGQSTPRNGSPAVGSDDRQLRTASMLAPPDAGSTLATTAAAATLTTSRSPSPSSTAAAAAAAAASSSSRSTVPPALLVAATENFITLLDAIQMGMVEKDVLHPLLRDIIQSVNKVTDDFENKGKIVEWLITLNRMGAAERLGEADSRQFDFDMKQAYHGFKSVLSGGRP